MLEHKICQSRSFQSLSKVQAASGDSGEAFQESYKPDSQVDLPTADSPDSTLRCARCEQKHLRAPVSEVGTKRPGESSQIQSETNGGSGSPSSGRSAASVRSVRSDQTEPEGQEEIRWPCPQTVAKGPREPGNLQESAPHFRELDVRHTAKWSLYCTVSHQQVTAVETWRDAQFKDNRDKHHAKNITCKHWTSHRTYKLSDEKKLPLQPALEC